MKTAIVGGGKGGKALIELSMGGFLSELTLEIVCVVDPEKDAPAMIYAAQNGIMTTNDINVALAISDLELIVELTGRDEVLDEIYWYLPSGVRLVDHTFARVFVDLKKAQEEQDIKIEEITALERMIDDERHFLQQLFDNLPDLVVVVDTEKRVVRINQSLADYVGISPDVVVGEKCEDLLGKTGLCGDCAFGDCEFSKVFDKDMIVSRVIHTSGEKEAYWQATHKTLKGADGKIYSIIGTWNKITERVLLEQEVDTMEERFQSFVNSANDMISVKDLKGRYVIANPYTSKLMGISEEEFIGHKPNEILPAELADTIRKHDNEVIESGFPKTYDEIITINDHDYHFHTTRFPLRDYQGNINGVCTIARDFTKERELQAQLVQTGKLAAVGKLAAGVAHEINNPLTGILAFAEDIHDELETGDPIRDDMNVIIRETLRCRDIVRNLLDFSRQDAPVFKKADLNEIVKKSLILIEKLPRFRDIELNYEFGENLPKIKCDFKQIQQVIINLTMNAAEAMNGKGRIDLRTIDKAKQNYCAIEVVDDGPGVPGGLLNKVFEPFFSTKGTSGLGLAVTWGIIERHHGSIEVEKSEFNGALFRVLLPIKEI
jgi:two-component system, NtrC family, sensor kinase